MPNQPPLNPDALANLRLLADRATEEVRHAVIEPDILHKLLDLATAQPVVNSVEDVPASLQCIAWEEEPEHGLWKITEDETFVGLIIKSGRSWSPADKYTLRIERPEVPGA